MNIDSGVLAVFDGTGLHDAGTQTGQFQHIPKGDLLQLAGSRHDTGIRRIDAVHVRVNFAQVRLQARCHRHGRRITAAAAQRRDIACIGQPLEAGYDDDIAVVQFLQDAVRFHFEDAGLRMVGIGPYACLRSRQGNRLLSPFLEGGRQQGDGHLFSGREEHVHLAFRHMPGNPPGQRDQVIRRVAHGGNDDDDPVVRFLFCQHAVDQMVDLFRGRHAAATEFFH